jgi:hypothetical protein
MCRLGDNINEVLNHELQRPLDRQYCLCLNLNNESKQINCET